MVAKRTRRYEVRLSDVSHRLPFSDLEPFERLQTQLGLGPIGPRSKRGEEEQADTASQDRHRCLLRYRRGPSGVEHTLKDII